MTTKAVTPALVVGYVLLNGTEMLAGAKCSDTDKSRTDAINDILKEVSRDTGDSVQYILESINAGNCELLEIHRSLSFNGKTKVVLSDFETTDFSS